MAAVIKVGGQALADGVLMRSERAWAIARADGSVEVGLVEPRTGIWRLPGLRVLAGVVGGLRAAFGRRANGRRPDRRLLWTLLALEGVVLVVGSKIEGAADAGVWAPVMAFGLLVALRFVTPARLWRYHGAEHKAVAAHEAGIDLDHTDAVLACSRVHDRCGTNLVFLLLLASLVTADVPALLQLPAFVLSLALGAEIVSLAASRPRSRMGRVLLSGGRSLQRWVTTAEPTPAEQRVACRALAACLAAGAGSADEVDPVALAA